MSGYNDRRPSQGRDYRERSPARSAGYDSRAPRRDRRDDRASGYDDFSSGQQRGEYSRGGRGGRGGSRGGQRGYGGGRGGGPSVASYVPRAANLPDLPSNVDVPKSGKELPQHNQFRPKARTGRQIFVLANLFHIKSLPIIKIFQYDIKMGIPADSRRGRQADNITQNLADKGLAAAADLFGRSFIFDGAGRGWSSEEFIPLGTQQDAVIDLAGHTAARPNQMTFTVRNAGRVDVRGLVEYLQGTSNVIPQDQLAWLNHTLRDDPSKRFITRPKGLTYYVREEGLTFPLDSTYGLLEALRGFHQGVSTHFGRLSVNVDASTSAFHTPNVSLAEVIKILENAAMSRGEVSDYVSGIYFYVRHLGESRTTIKKKCQGLAAADAISAQFEEEDHTTGLKRQTTVADYFKRKYNIDLNYPRLPLLKSRDALFPPELCFTCAGERYKGVLEGRETRDFIKIATSPARDRKEHIMQCIRRLAWHQQAKLQSSGLSVATQMMQVPASLLQPPKVEYARGSQPIRIQNGAWNLIGKSFLRAASFTACGVLYFPIPRNRVSQSEIEVWMKGLYQEMGRYSMGTPTEAPVFIEGNAQGSIEEIMKETFARIGNFHQRKPDFLFIFLHDGASKDVYSTSKLVCETMLGMPCQVMIVERSIRCKGSPAQYQGNVAMKVNCKLGGIPSHVVEPLLQKSRYMMIGGDVSHGSAAARASSQDTAVSFAALTGSWSQDCTQFCAITCNQQNTVELMAESQSMQSMEAFPAMVTELLARYRERNGNMSPERIIYWRDGVGDSQEKTFLATEVQSMQDLFKKLGLNILLTVVLCVKRHHTRFFPTDQNADKLGNILPGTVVESSDNSAFVTAHGALQGTVRPTHYKMLLNENNLSTDEFHRLIMNGCYTYGRATRAVNIHPAVYYADLAASRASGRVRFVDGVNIVADVHKDLRFSAWFL